MILTYDQQILIGLGLIVFTFILFPIFKYFVSKAQMKGWLDVLKQNKEESKNVKKER